MKGRPYEDVSSLKSKVEAIRRKITELKSSKDDYFDAKVPKAIALERLDKAIADLASGYRPRVAAFTWRDFQQPDLVDEARGYGGGSADLLPVAQFIAAIAPDQMRKFLADQIEREYSGGDGISDDDVLASASNIEAKLFELECQEERLICQAEEVGIFIARRHDADPKAMLAV